MLSGTVLCAGLTSDQKNPTECGVPECNREVSPMRRPWPTGGAGCRAMGGRGGGRIPTPCCRRFSIDL